MVLITEEKEKDLISVGIDIGTTTTQLVISKLKIKNIASGAMIPRMEIIDKEILYKSKIYFTPLLDYETIDAQKIAEIVKKEYATYGIKPEQIETGAIIITGETAKKENAKNIVESLAGLAGEFVVATAGPNLESIFAGKGSGAAAYSKQYLKTVINVDIGGGTSNICVFRNGNVIDAACINIGGRLLELETEKAKIKYISQPMKKILKDEGIELEIGQTVDLEILKRITIKMARIIINAITSKELWGITKELLMTSPLRLDYQIDEFIFSGGVADFIYQDGFNPLNPVQVSIYGDIGPLLGWAIRKECEKNSLKVVRPKETIRATVIGAGTHSVNVSGSTIKVEPELLPLRNVYVISPFAENIPKSNIEIAETIKKALTRYALEKGQIFGLYFNNLEDVNYELIQNLAEGILLGLENYLDPTIPIIVILEKDFGKVLGLELEIRTNSKRGIICIDQISVSDGDLIDIGKPLLGGRVVPVIIKTLIFD